MLTFSTLINVPLTIHFVNRVYDFFIFSPVPPGYAIKDLLASLTILYCVGRDLMAAPFSSANIGIGLFEDDVFSTFWDYAVFVCEFWD